MIKRLLSLLGMVFASLVSLTGCQEANIAPQPFEPAVRVLDVANQQQTDIVYFPAIARAADLTALSFRMGGEIVKLDVKEGELVAQGQVLAQLDATDFRIAVDNARASYQVLDSQYSRSKALVDRGLLAQSQFDEIRANRAIAKADLDLAKLRLSFTQLVAPFDGIISRVSVDNFQNVAPGETLFSLHRIDSVEVVVQIPDSLVIAHLNPETQIETSVKSPQGNVYPSTLKEFTTEPDPTTGTYTVTLTMPMPEQEPILDGMALEATNQAPANDFRVSGLISIPVQAVVTPDNESAETAAGYVWLLNPDNTVNKQLVELGRVQANTIAISGGLSPDDTVVIAGMTRLRDGQKVLPVSDADGQLEQQESTDNE